MARTMVITDIFYILKNFCTQEKHMYQTALIRYISMLNIILRFAPDKLQAHVVDHTAGSEMSQVNKNICRRQRYIVVGQRY